MGRLPLQQLGYCHGVECHLNKHRDSNARLSYKLSSYQSLGIALENPVERDKGGGGIGSPNLLL